MSVFVFNGWAAGPETWSACAFGRDRAFDYLEQLDGAPEKALDALDGGALLVGFSMGGSTALRMFLRTPEKVKGLVLISTTACMMEKPCGPNGEPVAWKGMSEHRRAALKLGTQIAFRGNPSPLFEEHNLDRGLDYLQETDLRAALLAADPMRRSHLAVSVFQSERDGIVRPHNAAFLKSVFPQAEVTMVPGNEHLLPVTIPAAIDAAVGRLRL